MKKCMITLLLSLALCVGLSAPALAAEQKIVVGDQTYGQVLQALLSQTEDEPVTLRLESDIQLSATVVLGSSDYGGLFNGEMVTIASHDITIDLNGYTLSSAQGNAIFDVQSGYTLAIVDHSAAKSGKLVFEGGEAVTVETGAVYHPLAADGSGSEPVSAVDAFMEALNLLYQVLAV